MKKTLRWTRYFDPKRLLTSARLQGVTHRFLFARFARALYTPPLRSAVTCAPDTRCAMRVVECRLSPSGTNGENRTWRSYCDSRLNVLLFFFYFLFLSFSFFFVPHWPPLPLSTSSLSLFQSSFTSISVILLLSLAAFIILSLYYSFTYFFLSAFVF
jgi:hypothetical protein